MANTNTQNIKVPAHVAFIMDGNGRWASQRGMVRNMGHRAGVEAVRGVIDLCREQGIRFITFYAFSTENWKRAPEEVEGLFELFREFFQSNREECLRSDIRIKILGDTSKFPDDLKASINSIVTDTKDCRAMTVAIALNYGARDEILRAVQLIKDKNLPATQEQFESCLYTAGMPDPDLIIRTSGEERLSNFLLYQAAYAELYFEESFWPDFGVRQLRKALKAYNARKRRFGK